MTDVRSNKVTQDEQKALSGAGAANSPTLCWHDLTGSGTAGSTAAVPGTAGSNLESTNSVIENTAISGADRALAYGDGLFATMRVLDDGRITCLDTHLSRLAQGMLRLGFFRTDSHSGMPADSTSSAGADKPSAQDALLSQLLAHIKSRLIIAASLHKGGGLKLILSRGEGGRGYLAPSNPKVLAVLSAFALPAHYSDWRARGVALASASLQLGRQPKLAGMKHLNRLEQVLIRAEPLPDWADDFLVKDCNGEVIESSMANLVFIVGNTCITPHHSYAGVSGVMRQCLLEALLSLGYRVEAKAVSEALLTCCDAVLMSNSLMGVIEVRRINHHYFPEFHGIDAVRDALDSFL
ncbi:aminodeoxychorismate lyase [Shewanella sp. JM162201]|uniref:Aminodeoxychorismate lyase n=1 Tax=Shewanella jiangmenensis TaxID=2837387 RepID=A0ABS5V7A8_9GAMM|nr:aminodeoxychorismate lyase [Shewanella jiangmenensis]MBT1445835.1 aminodeoxychorismate lyase [Shewanella jiangmenensis]